MEMSMRMRSGRWSWARLTPFLAVARLEDAVADVLEDGAVDDEVVLVVLDEQDRLLVVAHDRRRRGAGCAD
jgi:hypothetical protein